MGAIRLSWWQFSSILLLVTAVGCDKSPGPTRPLVSSGASGVVTSDRVPWEMYIRVCDVGMAYSKATEALGRAPVSLAELQPYLVSKDALTTLRDGKPFEIRAVEGVNVSGPLDRLLVWEATPDKNGERYVFQESQGGYRVGAQEFQALLDGSWIRERWLPRKPLFPSSKP
ncbi:MAG: hypothetical protein R3B84_20580 [Zavarzinella sp.]